MSNFTSYSNLKNKKSAGYSMVELVIVVAIIGLMSVIIASNFPKIKLQLALSRSTYQFGQSLRKAQSLALSNSQYKDSSGVLHAVDGFGGYISLLTNTQFILYADNVPGNQKYDGAASDYLMETVNLENGIYIKQINFASGNNVSINFQNPNSTVNLDGLIPNQTNVTIVFAISAYPSITKTVSINSSGLVEVSN